MQNHHWDVVIIGGAVTGSATAWWILQAEPHAKVIVIEKDPTYACAATALSVASVRQQFSNPVNVEISRFGIDFIRHFAERTGPEGGVGSLGLKENGYLFLSGTDEGAATLAELAVMQNRLGAATAVLRPAELADRYPWMNVDDVSAGSIGLRDEGWFDNMGLLNGFRNAARAKGARFIHDRVTGLDRAGDRIVAALTASGQRIAGNAFLCAAGTGATEICAMAGISFPVEPRKRTVFVIDAPNARHPDAPLIIDHTGIYLRPEHNDWITATVPDDDGPCDRDDWEPDHAQFEDLIWPRLYARSEGFDAVKVLRLWVGHYDYNTLDQNAVVGRWPGHANFHVAAGFSGHGLQQAPAVGRGMAEVILTGGYRTLDLSPLGPERVLSGRPFLEKAIV